MSDAPDRITAWAWEADKAHGEWDALDTGGMPYVRADIADDLLAALQLFVDEYTEFVNSGDAGFWDPEEEHKVIAARAAIAKAKGQALTRSEPRASMAEQFEAEMSSAADREKAAEAKGQP